MLFFQVSSTGTGADSIRLTVAGELNEATVWDLRKKLATVVSNRPAHVTIDLTKLRSINDAGVGVLVAFHRRLRFRGTRTQSIGLHGQPLAKFRQRGLNDIDWAPADDTAH
jgi:anti-anti-sigma factor